MKIFLALCLAVLVAGAAWAGLDPDPDQMGVYFDPTGDVVCTSVEFATPFTVYLIYTNPTLTTIRGFECSLEMAGADSPASMPVNRTYAAPNIELGRDSGTTYNLITGFTAPVPTSAATVLVELQFFCLDTLPLDFFLGAADPASLGSALPIVMAEDYSLLPVGMSAPVGPAAQVNGADCLVVATDEASWDSIKAMYR